MIDIMHVVEVRQETREWHVNAIGDYKTIPFDVSLFTPEGKGIRFHFLKRSL